MRRNYLFLKLLLGWVFAGHVLTGLLAFVSGEAAVRFAASLYGADFIPHPQFLYIIRPLGVYMLGFALLQFLAIRDPWRYRPAIDATLVVLALRQLQRIVFAPDIFAAFGIPPARHWLATAVFTLTAVLLLIARLQMGREPGSGGEPAAGEAR
jgi:hypothetical protein